MKKIWMDYCAVDIFSSYLNEKYIDTFRDLAKFLAIFFFQNVHKAYFHYDISNNNSSSHSNSI